MKQKYIINIILIGSIISILICIILEKKGENDIEETPYIAEKLTSEIGYNEIKSNLEIQYEYLKEEVDETFEGYEVCAKLEIPTISLKTNILSQYSKEALKVCVTKFWGVEPNEIGNFCIAGHNSKNKNMFYNIKKLKVGDTLFITDKRIGKVEYQVFNVSKVSPKDISCLEAITNRRKRSNINHMYQ